MTALGLSFRYLGDGVMALLLPVSTIRTASERVLSASAILFVVLFFIVVAWLIGALPLLAGPTGGTDLLGQIAAFQQQLIVVRAGLHAASLLLLLAGLVVLFFVARLLGGKGSFQRFMAAALVLAGVWSVGVAVQSVAMGVVLAAPGENGVAILIELFAPVLFAMILLSFSVLVARFGGLLDLPRAFLAVLVLVAISALGGYLIDVQFGGPLLNLGRSV